MTSARATSFWWFQIAFWLIAGVALFISGLSQVELMPALIRNLFLMIAGFLTSFFLTTLIDRLRRMDELRLRLTVFPVAYVVALLCTVTINAISFTMAGYSFDELDRGMWFSGTMNFALVYWFWAELFIQQVYLKGRPRISPAEQKKAGPDKLLVEDRGSKLRLDSEAIVAIMAAGDYVEIDIGDRVILDRKTIQSLEDRLAPLGFLRVHRSAIVNPDYVNKVTPLSNGRFLLEMSNERQIASSKSHERFIREQLLS